jgi:hypothetical protein
MPQQQSQPPNPPQAPPKTFYSNRTTQAEIPKFTTSSSRSTSANQFPNANIGPSGPGNDNPKPPGGSAAAAAANPLGASNDAYIYTAELRICKRTTYE